MTISLNVFLFNENIKDVEIACGFISDGYSELTLKDQIQIDNQLANQRMKGLIKSNNNQNVGWVEVFRPFFEINNISNNTHSFIFLYKYIKEDIERIFAFTAGYGWTGIDKSKIIGDFGIKVSLNLLSDKDITLIDSKKLSLSSHQNREVSSQRSSFYEFVFDEDEEFMDRVAGVPLNHQNIKKVNGRDSLKVEVVSFRNDNVNELCEKLLELYDSNNYQNHFSFVDNIKETKDSEIWEYFLEHLSVLFLQGAFDQMKILYPDIEECSKYSYEINYPRHDQMYYSDFGMDVLAEIVSNIGNEFNYNKLKINLMDENNIVINDKKRNLLEYLVVEFDKNGKKYLYSGKKIFEIAQDFFEEVRDFVRENSQDSNYISIKYKNENGKRVVENEGLYNERLKDSLNNAHNFDQNNYRITGRSSVEMCDVLTQEKQFICVKKYVNSSSSISHLFSQVIASAETFTSDGGVIEWLNSEAEMNIFENNDKNNSGTTFVLGIAINKEGQLHESLPFLAQVSLRRVIKVVKKMGYNVFATKIEFEEDDIYNY